MMKYLLVAIVILAFVHFARRSQRRSRSHQQPHNPQDYAPPPSTARSRPVQPMVSCAWCGLHLPLADATTQPAQPAALHFCCDDHRRRHTGGA